MNTKHTPGPWRIGDAGLTIFGPKTDHPAPVSIVELPGPTPRVSASERRANALLIAKAPDMLEGLRNAAHDLDGPHDPQAIRARLLALIAQATGH